MQVAASQNPANSQRSNWRSWLIWVLVLGVIVAGGSDREPADATRPIVWHEPPSERAPQEDVLRIASFNIHGGKGSDRKVDLARTAAELQNVDFAGLFEVHASPWTSFPNQAAALGDRIGMRSAFLATERRWWHDHFGNGLLTARPIQQVLRVPLMGTRGKAFRQAVLIDVPLQEKIVHFVMVHVDSAQDREQQLAAVIRLFESLQAPAVLIGDLNSPPADPQLQELLSQPGVQDVLPAKLGARAPADHIDWIITRGLECVDADYHDSGASDHPVIKATLRLP